MAERNPPDDPNIDPIEDDDDPYGRDELFDEDKPPRLGQKWTPALHNVVEQSIEDVREQRRQREANEGTDIE
jgi:hypothetical protein